MLKPRLINAALIIVASLLPACAIFVPPPRSYSVSLADVDGDGDADAVVGNGPGNTDYAGEPNAIWLNDGAGHFADSGQRLIGHGTSWDVTYAVALGDLDGDGDADILFGNAIQAPDTVWYNDGTGRFEFHREYPMQPADEFGYSMSAAVALGDFDGDGDLDAYVGNCCRGQWIKSSAGQIDAQGFSDAYNAVWLNDGAGRFTDSGQRLGNWATGGVALGDLDGDGDLDAFEANRGGREFSGGDPADRVWLNDGTGHFTDSDQWMGASDGYAVALGDVDGDGDLDAYVGNAYFGPADEVWLNDGSGRFTDSEQRLGDENTRVVVLDDVDRDGDLDAFVGSDVAGQIWTNDGSGRFQSGQRFDWNRNYVSQLADVDGDGDRDVFAIRFDGRCLIWRNDGTGRFRRR